MSPASNSLPAPGRPCVLLLWALFLAALSGCSLAGRGDSPHATEHTYAHRLLPDITYDLRTAMTLDDGALVARLAPVTLLFLGEHHTDPRSHAFQAALLRSLAASGRKITVGLEMFPPSADPALDAWRTGALSETEFLERSGWYEHWGFPWGYYREVFQTLRDLRLPVRGLNADNDTRKAVREGKLDTLSAEARAELGDLEAPLEPHRDYVADILSGGGHSVDLEPGAPAFQRYYRVQRMWDRLMGLRAARLAEQQPPQGLVVVLIGSGHLAWGLGANLHAARALDPARVGSMLTLWDDVLPPEKKDAQGRLPLPVGMADLARVYEKPAESDRYPSLAGVTLEPPAESPGLRVKSLFLPAHAALSALKAGDRILSLNGVPMKSATALRLAYETLPFNTPARIEIQREGVTMTVEITPRPSPH
ncbi:MAG: ChaN family lipoprotein [Deltaproteobacteria bacterium]|nr:ChaN family lipoprotein [Deltaproteobacteria bacterium]